MQEDYVIRQEDLIENPTARVPICLVLDVSGSMEGDPIAELHAGVQMFFEAIRKDDVAQYAAEISIVTFGGTAQKVLDFSDINRQDVPPLVASGLTPMGHAVNIALDLLEARKEDYQRAGVDYYQPWMVLMTDGEPTDDIGSAAARVASLISQRKLSVFPIAIGTAVNMQSLSQFSPTRPPLRLKGLNFNQFFDWLSRSVSRVSQSTPGEEVALDIKGIEAWAQI
ncbi:MULTISPECIES: VWA domain-containing protein [unclassified Pseudomonas]|uniref:VWA domain-containing protein n=1 Tax=unclassified Pseudomonas TaxID=196821 RepID=UPI002AC8D610|nr:MULTISPECIES: VWA domain-containing protein [unclassified Pseudomonas]MEB0048412.1 VWA domain-containing protein [Pseudomonas sp. Dout3]MEB0099287.1 VWA domain-containing protein [Pseudomonas sp. DC1.2]WPX57998.1 VWA domain-containing protein [Pseudomonas sp. DC1.2]